MKKEKNKNKLLMTDSSGNKFYQVDDKTIETEKRNGDKITCSIKDIWKILTNQK